MFPADEYFPFRVDPDGQLWRFNKRLMKWAPYTGTKDDLGYYLGSWAGAGGKRVFKRVHQIVWAALHGAVPDGLEIDHIDGDKANNRASNLRLVTHAENLAYARELRGNWAPRKLKPHQIQLTLDLPSWAPWQYWADRWGVHKVTLLTIRCKANKDRRMREQLGTQA